MTAYLGFEPLSQDTSEFVPWRHGLVLPRRFRVRFNDERCPYIVELEIEPRDGRPVAVDVRLSERGDGVTSGGMRAVRINYYLDEAARQAAWERHEENGVITITRTPSGEALALGPRVRPPPGRLLSDEHLDEISRVYRDALAAGSRAPRKAVVEHWHRAHGELVKDQTAATWIQKARRRGFLEPTEERKAGG